MGKVTYAVNERARRIFRYVIIAAIILVLVSPFFIFSSFGTSKIHGWAVEKNSPGLLYFSARIHCIMGGLNEDRFAVAEDYFREFVRKYPNHKKAGHAYFYIAWCIEEQNRFDEAREEYQYFVDAYPNHDKTPMATRALNRIEALRPK